MSKSSQMKEHVEKLNLYREVSTNRICEGRLFEDFVIVRPVLREFHNEVKKIPIENFGKEYDDYQGDRSDMARFLMRSSLAETMQ